MSTDTDTEWTTVSSKNRKRRPPAIRQKDRFKPADPNEIPVKHFWDGFNSLGSEIWFVEFANGNLISCNDDRYDGIIKRFFPDSPAHI